ncbi:hypothetical protein D2V07_17650 [Aurantiacibacter zhengii]|uniref:Uncharacterized protein n=1 Tax=Aurantiacibacter zhengii TaxID=2307003 RepID=A0A418NNI3_9SPHN|nr:hypothetical protein D2V07_17650 [Aurantiacibacter zhengii]
MHFLKIGVASPQPRIGQPLQSGDCDGQLGDKIYMDSQGFSLLPSHPSISARFDQTGGFYAQFGTENIR